jgi:uroporphyrinogen decarboxylase
MNWTPRERVISAIEHREPDRVPIDITPVYDSYMNIKAFLNLDIQEEVKPSFHMEVIPHPKVLEAMGADITAVKLETLQKKKSEPRPDGLAADAWGVLFRKVRNSTGSYMEAVHNPLSDLQEGDLETYPFPDPQEIVDMDATQSIAHHLYEDTNLALMGRFGGPIIEVAIHLMGFEKWLLCAASQPELAGALLDKITDIQIDLDNCGLQATAKYLQILKLSGDDFGMQTGLLYSPGMFRNLFLPRFKRRWAAVLKYLDQVNPAVKLMFHSCGGIRKIIPDLIAEGIQILDPIQPHASGMDSAELKCEFGDQLVFHGGVDIQKVLPFGTREDVEEEVKLRISALAPGGGYILSSSHFIQSDTPPGNVVTMCQAAHRYGKYPISSELPQSKIP